jgi:hypothetical protein
VALPLAAPAQAIHKCVALTGVAYQSAPCAAGEADILIDIRPGASGPRPSAPHTMPSTQPAKREPAIGVKRLFQKTRIAIGMTDDEVLNLPSWGRPSSIARSKSNRIWHEEWLYRWSGAVTSRLSFANGRLTGIESDGTVADPATPVSLTLR